MRPPTTAPRATAAPTRRAPRSPRGCRRTAAAGRARGPATSPAPRRGTPPPARRTSGPLVAYLVGHAGEVELEGEPLLVPVAALDVPRVDAVERLLGSPDHGRVLGRDLAGHVAHGGEQLRAGHHAEHRTERVQLGGGGGRGGV